MLRIKLVCVYVCVCLCCKSNNKQQELWEPKLIEYTEQQAARGGREE